MADIVRVIRGHPRRALLIGTGIGISVVAFQFLWRRFFSEGRKKLPGLRSSVLKLSERCEIDVSSFNSAIDSLEALLSDLEPNRFSSDLSRGQYELVASVISRLRGVYSDLQRYVSKDFRKKISTEDIARSVWNEKITQNQRAGTLSVFSDDSFATAFDDLNDEASNFESVVPTAIDYAHLPFYVEGLKAANEGRVHFRRSRAEFCKCESELDFMAKLYCLRKAFRVYTEDEHKVHWLIQSGRVLIADLLRHSGRDVTSFYIAYDRMMEFLIKEENQHIIFEELEPRKVEEMNLWDVLFDFIILDAFDDLRKPPNTITALVKNNWLGSAMKESMINNVIWSLIKMKRSRLQHTDGFISRFYDISSILTTPLTFGLLGGGTEEFEEICIFFKDSLLTFVIDIFDVEKVRYTSLLDLSEDVEKLMTERVELIHVKLSNEILPPP